MSIAWDPPGRSGILAEVARPQDALVAAAVVGLAFERLFVGVAPGIAFGVFTALFVAAIAVVARRHELAASAGSAALGGCAVLLATAVALRADPATTAVNFLVTGGLLAMLVHAYGNDRWLRYGLRDWLLAALRLAGHEITGGGELVAAQRRRRTTPSRGYADRAVPVLRGLAVAVPLVAVLGVLLASADAVFADGLGALGRKLTALQIDELVTRIAVGVTAAYVAAGGLRHLLNRRDDGLLGDRPVPRVLGFTEAAVVLVSLNVLFGAFVLVQIRYFFGGHAAMTAGGMSYAEYARRGFGELVAVAVITLGVHLALAGLTRRPTPRARWTFSALTSALTGFVLVMLVSSFQRLVLYEQAFGFTRLRTFVHVFIVWLAVLLVVLLLLEAADRVRLFLLATIVAVVGFAVTLNAVGMDALIARHNLARAVQGSDLDVAYLQRLSPDAVPPLAAALPALEPPLAASVRDVLACIAPEPDRPGGWRAWRLSEQRADAALRAARITPGPCDPYATG